MSNERPSGLQSSSCSRPLPFNSFAMHLDTCVISHRSRCLAVAQGVQGAAVVICFLSQQYQLSENCKLELKFACQTGIPIVPVMLEATVRKVGGHLTGLV